jgi:gliding motility-associated-like protein
MMKKIIPVIIGFLVCPAVSMASHIKGGWIHYQYAGVGAPGTYRYSISVYVYADCDQPGPLPGQLGIFDAVTYDTVMVIPNTSSIYKLTGAITKQTSDPCLSQPHKICYQVYVYQTTITVPANPNGYLLVAQDAYRVANISNISSSDNVGITFLGKIPGIINNTDYHVNTSPVFASNDTVLVCQKEKFSYLFNATDADGDKLTYSFGSALNGASVLDPPPYFPLNYRDGYSGAQPMGKKVTIDSLTGLISGICDTTGEFVITVYAHEWRNGVLINSTKKEMQIKVGDCSTVIVRLDSVYLNCKDYTIQLENKSTASNINYYLWDFGVPGMITDSSTRATPSFTYNDTGTYTITLFTRNTNGCRDSATALVKIYPGFEPAIHVAGRCYQSPFLFSDKSLIRFGTVIKRRWDLGDPASTSDTFSISSPVYRYPAIGIRTVTLYVETSAGCSGETSKVVQIDDKPYLEIPFTDTLICSPDTLSIQVKSSATQFQWSPARDISGTSIQSPLIYPEDTTVYKVIAKDQDCIDSASIRVNVVKFIDVSIRPDTSVCNHDSIMLNPVSEAVNYQWRESGNGQSIRNTTIKYPVVTPQNSTTYYVVANLGKCQDSSRIHVTVSPPPQARLGNDTAVCFNTRMVLNGSIQGDRFVWTASTSLTNTNTLHPLAQPSRTSTYILTAYNDTGCLKRVSDSMTIFVRQPFSVDAGKDTMVGIGEPLPIFATGADPGYRYQWSPNIYLDNYTIANPVVTISSSSVDSMIYRIRVMSPEGCSAQDNLTVRVYKGGPDILVPSGFSPNGDGRNDELKPILIGISKLAYFTIYNRTGQVLFTTSQHGKGWDGTYKGIKQPSAAYVYAVQGQNYTGKMMFRKGTVVLIN